MKLLSFVDLHENHSAFEKIKEKSKHSDLIICAGDISIFENNLDKLFVELNKLKKPLLIIPGNHESEEDISSLAELFENIQDIHRKILVKGNYVFIGYGGGGFSMVDNPFEKASKKIEKELKKHKDKKVILVTHAPPYKTSIDKISREHCGNKSLKNFILNIEPDLVISGHFHENAGKEDKIGKTRIINPGPFGKIISV